MSSNMPSGCLPETNKGKEPEPEIRPQLSAAPSSASTLVSTSAIEEPKKPNKPHDALFRAFNIWLIYENIFSHVAVADQAALALTCSSLRKSLTGVADVPTLRRRLSRPEFLDVLWTVARDLPDHHVCEQCMYLHRVDSAQTGHASDVLFVQRACEDFLKGTFASSPIPELEPPCRLHLLLNPLSASNAPTAPSFDAGMSSMTFMSRLSLTRRTPLSGLAHRDVQLLLKRMRLLREWTGPEGVVPKDVESMDVEQSVTKFEIAEQSPSPAPSPRWKSWTFWCGKFGRRPSSKTQTQQEQPGTNTKYETKTKEDLVRAVRCALQPFLAQRQLALPKCYFEPATVEYKFVPRMVLGDFAADGELPNGQTNGQGHGPGRGAERRLRPRFLLQTEISIGFHEYYQLPLAICPHQLINSNGCPNWERDRSNAMLALFGTFPYRLDVTPSPEDVQRVRPPFRLHFAVQCVARDRLSRQNCVENSTAHPRCHGTYPEDYSSKRVGKYTKLGAAGKRACAMARAQIDGHVLSASCNRCPTDFVVRTVNDPVGRLLKDKLVITVWQDFGTEAPMTSALWQSHIPGPFLQAEMKNAQAPFTEPNTWLSGPTVSHSPGSVRALFETGEPAYKF